MSTSDAIYAPETPADHDQIEDINAEAFGPGRFARAAYHIREGGPHEAALSFVARENSGNVIASVRLTRVSAGTGEALLLGPLAVRPAFKNMGIGRHLVAMAVEAARKSGHKAVILVGDEPYYGPLGFRRMPYGRLSLPRPVDFNRLLIYEIEPAYAEQLNGMLDHADRRRRD